MKIEDAQVEPLIDCLRACQNILTSAVERGGHVRIDLASAISLLAKLQADRLERARGAEPNPRTCPSGVVIVVGKPCPKCGRGDDDFCPATEPWNTP